MSQSPNDIDDEDFPDIEGAVIELAVLEKYLHDPAFAGRFISAGANFEDAIARTGYYPDEKTIEPDEFIDGGYKFFNDTHEAYAEEFESRLGEIIDKEKVDIYLDAFRQLWTDGKKNRQKSDIMMQIKASIRDHDRFFFPKNNVFVNKKNAVPEDVLAFFTPEEMRAIFDLNGRLANTCVEDYLASRHDSRSNSINRIYLHRGIFAPRRILDSVLVEENYLTSYSMAVTVPEVFAQTRSSSTAKAGEAMMMGAPFPLFLQRIVMFAPFIKGIKLGQLEVCVAPPLEIFPLDYHGSFPSGQEDIIFHEYGFDELPAGESWSRELPNRIIKAAE